MSRRGRKSIAYALASQFAKMMSNTYVPKPDGTKGGWMNVSTLLDNASSVVDTHGNVPEKFKITMHKRFFRIKKTLDQYRLNGPQLMCFVLELIEFAQSLPTGDTFGDRAADQRANLAKGVLFRMAKSLDWEVTAEDGEKALEVMGLLKKKLFVV